MRRISLSGGQDGGRRHRRTAPRAAGAALVACLLTLVFAASALAAEEEAPSITSGASATFVEGTEGSFAVTATGIPSPTITESGALPNGVTFNEGVLSGTPTQDGVYPISFDAGNGVGSDAVQSFTLTVDSAPSITSANNATFTDGTTGSFTVTANGTPSPSISETGALPAGVTFNPATGVLSGNPTATGTFTVSFTAANTIGFSTQTFTLTANSKPAITSASKATFTQGTAGSFTVTATGFPAPTISETGALPAGVTLSGGALSGTPTQNGVYAITLTASNGVGTGATQSFTLTVNGPPAFTSATSTQFTQGQAGTFTVTSSGTPAPAITEWGNMPNGVTFVKGVLSGTPTVPGTYQLTFITTNASGTAYQQFTLKVIGLEVTTTSLPSATIGTAYSQTLTAVNAQPPYSWKLTGGSLPKGLKLSKAGVISGTPGKTAYTHGFQVTVSDASRTAQQTAAATFTIVVNPAAAAKIRAGAHSLHRHAKVA